MSSRRASAGAVTSEKKKRRRAPDEENDQSSAIKGATKRRRNSISTVDLHDQLVERAAHHRPETRHRPGSEDAATLQVEEAVEEADPAPTRGKKTRQSLPAARLPSASPVTISPVSETSSSRRKRSTTATSKLPLPRIPKTRKSRGAEPAASYDVRTSAVSLQSVAHEGAATSRNSASAVSLQSVAHEGASPSQNSASAVSLQNEGAATSQNIHRARSPVSPQCADPDPSLPEKHDQPMWPYLVIISLVCIAFFLIVNIYTDTGTKLIYIMNNTTCRMSSWGDGEEWKCGVKKEHIRMVQHAEEVLQQQRDALSHWRSRHYGAIEPALGRIERQIDSIRKSTTELMNKRAKAAAGTNPAAFRTDDDDSARELQDNLSALVDSVSGYVMELESAFTANAVGPEGQELPSSGSSDCARFMISEEGFDLYYQCLLDKVQSSLLRINSLPDSLPPSSLTDVVEDSMTSTGELELRVNTLLADAATLSYGINVRISVDNNTLQDVEATAAAVLHNRLYASTTHLQQDPENGASVDRYEDAAPSTTLEDPVAVSYSDVDDLLQSKIEASAREIINATLSAAGDYSAVREIVGAAIDWAVEEHSDALKIHTDAVRAFLSDAKATLPVNTTSYTSDADSNHGGDMPVNQRELDDLIAERLASAGDVDETVIHAVDNAIREILATENASQATAIVQSETDINNVFSGVALSRQRLLGDEEITWAAYYALGNLDIGSLLGHSEGEDEEKPLRDFEEVNTVSSFLKYIDYAVGPRGGKVFVHPSHTPVVISSSDEQRSEHQLTSSPYRASSNVVSSILYHSGFDISQSDPNAVLSHRMPPDVGHCYAFAGTVGNVTVMLHSPVHAYGVGVYHPPLSEFAPGTPDSAPRRFAVYGWANKPTVHGLLPGMRRVVTGDAYYLGEFVYERQRGSDGNGVGALQKFTLARSTGTRGVDVVPPFSAVTFAILDNYGNNNYTCVYRLQVLGELSKSNARVASH